MKHLWLVAPLGLLHVGRQGPGPTLGLGYCWLLLPYCWEFGTSSPRLESHGKQAEKELPIINRHPCQAGNKATPHIRDIDMCTGTNRSIYDYMHAMQGKHLPKNVDGNKGRNVKKLQNVLKRLLRLHAGLYVLHLVAMGSQCTLR